MIGGRAICVALALLAVCEAGQFRNRVGLAGGAAQPALAGVANAAAAAVPSQCDVCKYIDCCNAGGGMACKNPSQGPWSPNKCNDADLKAVGFQIACTGSVINNNPKCVGGEVPRPGAPAAPGAATTPGAATVPGAPANPGVAANAQISPKGQAQMKAILAYALANNNGASRGRCYEWVWKYLIGVPGGYGKISNSNQPDVPPQFARDFADWMNKGDNAKKYGLQKLNVQTPYDAPAGAIVVVPPGVPGTAHPVAGDIAIAKGDGEFVNDGPNMSYGPKASFPKGKVLGVYVPE